MRATPAPLATTTSIRCVDVDSYEEYLKHACETQFLTDSSVGGYLFVCDELPHADEYMPDLGGPDVQVAIEVQKLEGGRYFVVGKFCRPSTRQSSFNRTRITYFKRFAGVSQGVRVRKTSKNMVLTSRFIPDYNNVSPLYSHTLPPIVHTCPRLAKASPMRVSRQHTSLTVAGLGVQQWLSFLLLAALPFAPPRSSPPSSPEIRGKHFAEETDMKQRVIVTFVMLSWRFVAYFKWFSCYDVDVRLSPRADDMV